MPRDCNYAKTYMSNTFSKKNHVIKIDPDTSLGDDEGNVQPFYAYCNQEEFPHVGVTEIQHILKSDG